MGWKGGSGGSGGSEDGKEGRMELNWFKNENINQLVSCPSRKNAFPNYEFLLQEDCTDHGCGTEYGCDERKETKRKGKKRKGKEETDVWC